MRRFALSLAIAGLLAASASPLAAQTACIPERPQQVVDIYSAEPFSARSWRVLNGLGDPNIESSSYAFSDYGLQDEWKKLAQSLAPDMPDLQNVAYDCRMGYPLQTLKERVALSGANDPYIKQWLTMQGKVLKACGDEVVDPAQIPPPLAFENKPELTKLQAEDRAYQEASIAFYTDKPAAIQKFKEIGASQSVHRAAARYNVANLLANANNVKDARAEANAILADPSLASVHEMTRALLGYVANIEDTAEGWTVLLDNTIATLSQPKADIEASEARKDAYGKALYDIDYAGIRAKRDDWWITATLPENPTLSKAIVDSARKHPMALWMMAGQSVNEKYGQLPWSFVGKTWSGWASSYVDRALALQPAGEGIKGPARDVLLALKAGTDDASRKDLWDKARAAWNATQSSCGDAPDAAAVAALLDQAVRVSAMAGKYDEIYDGLSGLPLLHSTSYQNVILPHLMHYLLATGNAAEGRRLRDKLFTPEFLSSFNANDQAWRREPYSKFMSWVAEDKDKFVAAAGLTTQQLSQPLLNIVSARTMRNLSKLDAFTAEQRGLLARTAWTRDYARGRPARNADTQQMLDLNPEIKAALDKVKADYPKLRADRQWLLTILRNPRFGILLNTPDWSDPLEAKRENFAEIDAYDHNDKNWWCPLQTDRYTGAIRRSFDEDAGLSSLTIYPQKELLPLLEPDALKASNKARDALLKAHPIVKSAEFNELRDMARAPSAPKKLSDLAIRWGKAVNRDDGAAEALALAVRTTRYGCSWAGGHGKYSQAAQGLLKNKFGQTSWAASTPYWFDCMRAVWDKDYNKVVTCDPMTFPKQPPLR
ncbi:MAG: hypothetical protein LCH46_12530 [Proteobacteria bacterium]|nr:hypothetical protein [Pseudomonadota bacterium]